MHGLNVLITNHGLVNRAGSELYTFDVATGLLARGHRPVVYSTTLGGVAEELRRATVPVIDDLNRLAITPDLIHGQHHVETMTALLHFPDTPAVFFCHGWLPWEELPPRAPRIRRYVAVDWTCRDRLIAESGIPPEQVEVIYNFVDLQRFLPRAALPPAPKRALVFSNSAAETTFLPSVRDVCARAGLELEVVGDASSNPTARPEVWLRGAEVVFAKARCALEALATGCAVILCDRDGLGPMVTAAELESLRASNFGIRCLREPVTREGLFRELGRYDAVDAVEVSRRIRSAAGPGQALDRILAVYEQAVAEQRLALPDHRAEGRAAAAYLRAVSPAVQRGSQDPLRRESERHYAEVVRLQGVVAQARAARDRLEEGCAGLRADLAQTQQWLAELHAQVAQLRAARDHLRHQLAEMATSMTLRLRAWAMKIPLLGSLKRFLLRRSRAC
jgi:Glycosyltransferase Family 4